MMRDLIRRFFDEVMNGPGGPSDILSPTFTVHHPAFREPLQGAAIARLMGAFRAAFPDLRYETVETIVEGDRAAVRWVASGRHDGDFLGISSTEREVTVLGTDIFHAANGQLTESWVSSDFFGLFVQLGEFPTPQAMAAFARFVLGG